MNVFLVQHSRENEGEEDLKVIGVYSSDQAARAAIQTLALQPGFRDTSDGFHVTRYEMDKTHWQDGFDTVRGRTS